MTGWRSRVNRGILIAASNAPAKDIAGADYVCDGTADEVQFNAALAALPATGGVLILSAGTFVKNATDITIPIDNVKIVGQGKNTIVKLADGVNASAQIFYASGKDGIEILDMVLGGNEAHNTSGSQYGINFVGCTNLNIDCWIENCRTADLIVDNIETCGKVCNRNYDDAYTPRTKTLLNIDGTGWTVVSGSPTITQDVDTLVGTTSLRLDVAAGDTAIIEHALVGDIRHYPMLQFLYKRADSSSKFPTEQGDFVITLIDSNDSEVSTNVAMGEMFAILDAFTRPPYETLTDIYAWHPVLLSATDFAWNNNHSILGDVAKIRILLKGHASSGTRIQLCQITAVRGLPRPIITLAFDDAKVAQHNIAMPLMAAHGWSGVVAANSHRMGLLAEDTTWSDSGPNPSSDVATWTQLRDFVRCGWDIVSHSASHASTEYIGGVAINAGYESRIVWEMLACKAAFEKYAISRGTDYYSHSGGGVGNYESVFRKFFKAGRQGYFGYNLPYEHNPCVLYYSSAEYADRVNILKFHLWAISAYHDIDAGFPNTLNAIRSGGIRVLTYSDVFSEYPLLSSDPLITLREGHHEDLFTALLAADDDYIHAGIAGTGGEQNVTVFANQPDHARTLSVKCTNVSSPSGLVFIYGTDARGYLLSQAVTISPGGVVDTTAAFATVSKVTIPATVTAADTITIGISDCLGLSHWILKYTDVISITRNGTPVAVAPKLFIIKNNFVSWEATVDLSTISASDDVVIRYRTNM